MFHFRGGLIKRLVNRGYEVVVIVPPGPFKGAIEKLGARCITIPVKRFVSPFEDLALLARLYKIFREERFDIVHNMTVKPNIFGTIAARLAGVKRVVCLVSGLGFAFRTTGSLKDGVLRWTVSYLYKICCRISDKIWFQNPDDFNLFLSQRIINNGKGIVITSGGINTEEYAPDCVLQSEIQNLRDELGLPANALCVLMLTARLVWSKGTREFVEAAEILRDSYPEWYFLMLTPKDPESSDAVPDEYICRHRSEHLIILDSFRTDIRVFITLADIMVLPSYYPEGVPRSLLEGLAMAKPIVTTDHPGCRSVVDHGRTGYLVPVKDSHSLAGKIAALMDEPQKREKFGRMSRLKAQKEFEEELVVNRVIKELYEL